MLALVAPDSLRQVGSSAISAVVPTSDPHVIGTIGDGMLVHVGAPIQRCGSGTCGPCDCDS